MTVRSRCQRPGESRRSGPSRRWARGQGGCRDPADGTRTASRRFLAWWRRRCRAPAGEDVQRGVGGAGGAVREPSDLDPDI